jgi:hypothetical protein
MAVRLVHAEHEGAAHPVPIHDAQQLFVVADHPVDVVAEMDVRIEGRTAAEVREPALQLVVPLGDQDLSTLEDVFHDRRG